MHAHARHAMFTLALLVTASGVTFAGAPMAKSQAPGWYRMKVGDFEVTALSDGTADLPVDQLLTNTTPDKVKAALAAEYLGTPVETSVNAFLINTGTKLVLIDAGAGKLFSPTLGKLVINLKAAGYQPAQIDDICITHMHVDHVGALAAAGKAVFPKAVIHAAKAEADFWLSEDNMKKLPDMKNFFQGAMSSLKPYTDGKKTQWFEGPDVEIVPGLHALAAPGHTPGHTVYAIDSKGERMVFWGDVVHVEAVQFAEPSVTIQFDSDAKAAAAQRMKLFADAVAKKHWIAVAHISFPGIGHVKSDGKAYEWVPANYTTKTGDGK